MKKVLSLLCLCGILISPLNALAEEDPIRAIYAPQPGYDFSTSYLYDVLHLALSKSGKKFVIEESPLGPMSEPRERSFIERGSGEVTLGVFGTSRDLEQRMRPVRIPLSRGLIGHRLFFIHKDAQEIFNQVETLEDLAKLTAVQGVGWSDVEILAGAGLNVWTSRQNNLFQMVEQKRVDYFPRGSTEIFNEYTRENTRHPNLVIERNLVLIYRFATFFFVNKDDKRLHDAIHDGLVAAYEDGSFMKLFSEHPDHKTALENAKLDERRALYVPNPLMTEETLDIANKYWIGEIGKAAW